MTIVTVYWGVGVEIWSHANNSTGKDVQFQATAYTKTSGSNNANYAMEQSNMLYLYI